MFRVCLSAFDFASPDQHAPMRYVTTVPQQALFFLNSPFVAEQCRALVARPEVAAAPTPSEKIRQLYRSMFGREPETVGGGGGPEVPFARRRTGKLMPTSASPWQYGTGEFRADTGRVESFTPFTVFVSDRWQGGSVLPAARSGKAVLRAAGGEPGRAAGSGRHPALGESGLRNAEHRGHAAARPTSRALR